MSQTNSTFTILSNAIDLADSASADAFGNLRISTAGNRFDNEFIYSKKTDEQIDEVLTTGGTTTWNTNTRDVTLAINNTTTGSSAGLYSHYDIPYTPGCSQYIIMTGVLDYAAIGSGTLSFFVRSSISGTPTDLNNVASTSWSAASTASLDTTKSQIFAMDFQSLKVGRIRFGFMRNGVFVSAGQITNDNVRNSGYWQLPSLPAFWNIYNDATYTYMEIGYGDTNNAIGFRYKITKNASATMLAICATVKSEGGVTMWNLPTINRAIYLATTISATATLTPILSIRCRTTFKGLTNRIPVIPLSYVFQADNPAAIVVLYRPTLTSPSFLPIGNPFAVGSLVVGTWYQIVSVGSTSFTAIGASANTVGVSFQASGAGSGSGTVVLETSSCEYDTTANAITGGMIVYNDFVGADNAKATGATASGSLLGKTIMALGRTGTTDILTLAAIRTTSTSANCSGGLNWGEIR